MKVAVLCESPADEVAIRILVDSLLGSETQKASLPPLRTRSGGWGDIIKVIPAVYKGLYYNYDAEALVVIADSDDSPVHQHSHDEIGKEDISCRLCQLRVAINLQKSQLRLVSHRSEIKTAIGLAVPAIEAWYRCGIDSQVSEAAWARKMQFDEKVGYTRRSLKVDVYGMEHPLIELSKARAKEAAIKLADNISLLEQLFPDGFGSFAREVRNWRLM